MITFDRLKYFKAVAMSEHVGRAAKSCAISPSVISSAVSCLEEELKCSLFDKQGKKLKLNENGRLLLEKAESLISQLESLYQEIGTNSVSLKGHYRVGATPILMRDFLIKPILSINDSHPDITTELVSIDTGHVLSGVEAGTIDFGLVFKSTDYAGIDEHVLHEGSLKICVRKGHSIFKKPVKNRVDALNNLPAITFKPSMIQNLYEHHPAFKGMNLSPKHRYFYNNNDSSIALIAATDGWAFLPDLVIKRYSSQIKAVDLGVNYKAPMKISLVKSKRRPPFHFFDLVKKELRKKVFF